MEFGCFVVRINLDILVVHVVHINLDILVAHVIHTSLDNPIIHVIQNSEVTDRVPTSLMFRVYYDKLVDSLVLINLNQDNHLDHQVQIFTNLDILINNY